MLNPKKIWHQQLVHLATIPVYCSHFTLGNAKSHFSTVLLFIHTSDYLHYLRRNKLHLLYCSLSVYLMLFTASYYLCCPILWSFFIFFVSHFVYLAADPQPALFRATKIWRNTTLPYLTFCRCKSFAFYEIVWWHFSGVVGKGVTVCFLLR